MLMRGTVHGRSELQRDGCYGDFASLTALSRLLHFVIRLHKIMASVLLVHAVYCVLGLCALIRQTAVLERPTWQGSEGDLWSAVREKLNRGYGFRRGSLSSQACR